MEVQCLATALYLYEAQENGELDLSEGDNIEVYKMHDDGWWHGKNLVTKKVGLFPSNFCQKN